MSLKAQAIDVFRQIADATGAPVEIDDNCLDDVPSRPRRQVYESSPTKRRRRRTAADIDVIRQSIYNTLHTDHPMTVRQVYYQLVSQGVIAKTESEYKQTVCRLLVQMRKDNLIPFDWIAENTRWMRKPTTYESLGDMLRITRDTYRRALWANQDAYVEVWLEKDALAGVVIEETVPWDVPLMVTRGYPSLSFLYSAAEVIAAHDKPTYLYYLGDWDPSGVDIPRKVEAGIREYAPDVDLYFERIAVNEDQITLMNLPTRPTKKSDSRARRFTGESVEVDAIPPDKLRSLVRMNISQHINFVALKSLEAAEESERELLTEFMHSYNDGIEGART